MPAAVESVYVQEPSAPAMLVWTLIQSRRLEDACTINVPFASPMKLRVILPPASLTIRVMLCGRRGVEYTITCCTAVALLPWISMAVQLTTLVPIGKTAGASLVTPATPQLSVTLGAPRTTLVA